MRIGIDCRLWNETGVGRYIRNLVEELGILDETNNYVLFFRKEEFETVPIVSKKFQKKLADIPWHSLKEQTEFKSILEKEKLDLVHFPYFSYPVGYKGKFVITIHDLIIDHFPTGKASTLPSPVYFLKHLGYKFVLQQAVKHAEIVLTVSGATKQELIDHYHPNGEKVVVTYEGIDRKINKDNQEKIDVKMPFFFSVGNAYPHKNLEKLVDAFEIFHTQHNDCNYIFVGKEDFFSKRLEEYVVKKGLRDSIFFYRNVTDGQLAYLYAHAIGLVIPSLMEGFGLPALEAMSNQCLVLASDISAFLEVCGDVPVYFDPYSAQDIAKKLELAYKKEINHILEKKRQGVIRARKFSWKEMAKQTIEVYKKAVRS